jgi:hypothetical protein
VGVYKETLYSQGGLGVVKAALKVSTVATPYGLSSEYLYFPFGILVKEALTDFGNL